MREYQSTEIKDLAESLAKAQAEMTHASKDASNPHLKSKYADLAAVIDAARPHLSKHGLSIVQITDTDEAGSVNLMTQLNHASGQWMRSWYPVKPVKNDPQGVGSALTYARRYSYASIVGVAAAGEDDDGNAASGKDTGEKKPAEYRGEFETKALLDTFVVNSIEAINAAKSGKDVVSQKELNLAKWTAMKSSSNPLDNDGYEKIAAVYNAAFAMFRDAAKPAEAVASKPAEPKTVDAAKADLPASVAADPIPF